MIGVQTVIVFFVIPVTVVIMEVMVVLFSWFYQSAEICATQVREIFQVEQGT